MIFKVWYKTLTDDEKRIIVLMVQEIAKKIREGDFELEVSLYGMIDYGYTCASKHQVSQSTPEINWDDWLEGIDFSGL